MDKRQRRNANALERAVEYCDARTAPPSHPAWGTHLDILRQTVATVKRLDEEQETQTRAKEAATARRDAALRTLRQGMVRIYAIATAHEREAPGIATLLAVPSRDIAVDDQLKGAWSMVAHAARYPDIYRVLIAGGTRTNLERDIEAVEAAKRERTVAEQAVTGATKALRHTLKEAENVMTLLGVQVRASLTRAEVELWDQITRIGRPPRKAVTKGASTAMATPSRRGRVSARAKGMIETGEADWAVIDGPRALPAANPLMLPLPRLDEIGQPEPVRERAPDRLT